MSAPVDVHANLRMALQHILICCPDETVQKAIEDADDAVTALLEADKSYDHANMQLRRAIGEHGMYSEQHMDASHDALSVRRRREAAIARCGGAK